MKSLTRKIGDVAKVKGGKRLPKGMSVLDEATEHPYLRVVDFIDGGIDRSNIKYIDKETFDYIKRYTIDRNDIYISIAGTIGRVGVVPDDLSGANLTENAAKITKISVDVDHRYLMYYLQSPVGQGAIRNRTGGTSQPKLALYKIADIDFPCPPLTTQQSIASILSAYDDLIDNNRRRIHLLEQVVRLLYKEWFVHLRFPGHEHVTITDGVPEGWTPATIADIGEVVTGKTPSKKKESYYSDDIPFIKTPDMHSNTLVIKTEESLSQEGANSQANKTLPPRSILVSCIGTVGAVAFNSSNAQTNQQINAIVPRTESLRYWAFFMAKDLKPMLESIGGGVTMANVNKSKFSSIKVIIPSALILDQFNSFVTMQIDQIEQLALMNLQLTQARDLLLPRLMNGEVAV